MQITFENRNGIGRVRLINPPRNAIDASFIMECGRLKEFLHDSPELKAAIIEGEGDHFCGGIAADGLKTGEVNTALESIAFAPVPVVAMVRGDCLDAGVELLLACHFRFAATDALIGFTDLGRPVASGAKYRDVPESSIAECAKPGAPVTGVRANALGLVREAVSSDELERTVITFVDSIVRNRSVRQIRSIMMSVHNALLLPRPQAMDRESRFFHDLSKTADI